MLVVDASCVVQVLTGREGAEGIRRRLLAEPDPAP
jgi:hypothetical protein